MVLDWRDKVHRRRSNKPYRVVGRAVLSVREKLREMGRPAVDMAGREFGRLSVLRRNGSLSGKAAWLCECVCGATTTVLGASLRKGHTKSCGCLAREAASGLARSLGFAKRTHGHSVSVAPTRTYVSWQAMRSRCSNVNVWQYPYYGGRGITVCERWQHSFENFLADMGARPAGMTLDRYPDVNGNYEPINCRWATRSEQGRNKRKRDTT